MIHRLQVVTELVLGFDKSFATPELLARQEALFTVLHGGLVALPINLPGTGNPVNPCDTHTSVNL